MATEGGSNIPGACRPGHPLPAGAVLAHLLFAAAASCAALPPAAAQDLKAGRRIALMCQGCHGLDGLSKQPDAPNLAMQPEIYLARALAAYKTGERRHEQMKVAAEGLSDADIANVSAYYAAIEIEVIRKP